MINALYEPLPESINVHGINYPVITDFREWLRFADMLEDKAISENEKLLIMTQWLLEPPDIIDGELVYALLDFYRARDLDTAPPDQDGEDEPEAISSPRPPVLSWKIDARYIIGDFRCCYGIDLLRIPYMHWWEFLLLLTALPENSQVQRRIAYRSCDTSKIKNTAERQRIQRIQQQIAIPWEISDEDIGSVFGGADY